MQVEIVTPLGAQYSGTAVKVEARGLLGEMGLLPGHRDMLSALGTGLCRVFETEHAEPTTMLVDEGYLQISHGSQVILVTELVERKEDIDVDKVRQTLAETRAKLNAPHKDVGSQTRKLYEHALLLDETRLQLADAR